jgi:hypothetical protein
LSASALFSENKTKACNAKEKEITNRKKLLKQGNALTSPQEQVQSVS